VPNGGSPASGALASNVFTISHSSQILGNFQFTLNGVGTSLQGQVASSATINLTIDATRTAITYKSGKLLCGLNSHHYSTSWWIILQYKQYLF